VQLIRKRGDAFSRGIAGTPAYLAEPILVSGTLDEADFVRAFALGRKAAGQ